MANERNKKLELTWAGKDAQISPEPRILLEQPDKAYGDKDTENMLIHGDNLLALKSLESDFAGKIKCIYIDPPYNTGNAFEYYDDGYDHSIWLSLMHDRLEILRNLLTDDGSIWISIDNNEYGYLKVLLDEIFGRNNEISSISVKVKDPAGVGQQSVIFDVTEYLVAYAKDLPKFKESANDVSEYTEIKEQVNGYTNHIKSYGTPKFIQSIERGGVGKIDIYSCEDALIERTTNISFDEYIADYNNIAADYNAGGGMIVAIKDSLPKIGLSFIEYTPIKGENKGKLTKVYFKNQRILAYLSNIVEKKDGKVYKRSKMTNLWEMKNSALHREGGVDFPNGKKAEHLIKRVLDIASNPGDMVLDSFLGSGTTAAVAHKMGRRWIGLELGDHAYTHDIPRMQKVIDGTDQGGISKSVGWTGGGGFKFYELASSLIVKDARGFDVISGKYNGDMLAEAMCKIMGYRYRPDKAIFWKQGIGTEKNFIFTTTMTISDDYLDEIAEELGDNSLLICCGGFTGNKNTHKNITIKKIPKAILEKCEWNKPGYPLPVREDFTEEDFEIEGE